MEKKRSTIRMLAVLMSFVFILSSAAQVFAAPSGQGGKDAAGGGNKVNFRPSPGSGTGGSPPPVPGWQFDAAAVKLSLVVTSTDGISRYNPSLNDGTDAKRQPLYSKINPVSLSCDTKAFADLEKEENLGCWGIGGVWIYMPENMYLDCGAAGGKADDEGAIKHTSKGFEWTRSNNNLQKYRLTEKILKSAYEVTKKKKDFNGDKLVICKDAGISSIGDLYDGFIYTNHQNRIYDTPWDKFLELGMTSIKTQKQAEDPANRPKIVGNKAVLYTLLTAMKKVHNGEDAKLDKLFDKALEATLTNDSDFRYIILMEIAAPLYGNSNDLLWLSTNSFAAACVCKDSKEFENFPKRHASKEKTSGMGAGSSSGLGGKNKNEKKETKKGGTSRMRGLLDLRQELDDKCNYSLRYGRGIGGAYQCWMGTLSGSSSARMNGQIDKPYTDGQSASEKRKDIVGSRLSYTGPILTNADGDVVRSKGFQTGKWSDEPKDIEKGDYEKYNWGWGVLSSEDAGIGAAPVMQKAVVSSTNISLVSTVTEAGKEKLDVPNFNFATLVPDGENSNGYKKLKSWATESLKSIKETGEMNAEVEKMLDEAVDWNTVKLPASDDEKKEAKKLTKKQREDIKKYLSLMVTGLWKKNSTFVTERNAEMFMQMLLSLNSNSSTSSSSSGNSVSADPSKGILLMSTAIKRQKQGTSRFKATSFDTETKQPLTQTVIAEFNTSNVITAEKLNIDTDQVGEGLVLEGAAVTGNTDDIKNFGYIADETVKEQGGSPDKKYFAQPIVMYGCYLRLDPIILVHNGNWKSNSAKALGSIDFTNADSIKKSKVDKTEKSKNDYVSIPKGSIDLATAELQALITDFIADSKEYLNILKTSGGDFKEEETKAILSRELQIRILMWLDVIRDMRPGVEYRSYTRSDGSNSDRIWADTESFWNVKQENQTDGIAQYRDKFTNKGYSFGANPASSKFESNKTKSSLGMVYCDFIPYEGHSREEVILENFGRIKIRDQYAVLANYTGTGSNKPESVWVYLGTDEGKGKQTLLESFDMLDVGEDKLGGDLGILRNKDGKQYVNVGALSQYVLSKEGTKAEVKSAEKSKESSSKKKTHSGDDKDKKEDFDKEKGKNKDANTEETEEEEEDTIYDGSSAAEVGGMAAAIDFITWDTDGKDKTKTANSVIARMRAIGEVTGSTKVVDAVLDGFGTSEAVQPKKMELFDLIDVKLNSETSGLSYGGNEGTDKFNISIDSADVGRLIQVALYVSTFCKRETGIPITTESEKAYYWIPGCPYTICKSPWDGGIDSIKGSKNPEGQQADKSVVYRMNGDSEKFADKRISGYSGKNVELHEHTKDIDAITTITLNETFSSMMDIEEKVNSGETWLTDNMKGTYGHSGSILDLAIPVDIVTLFMDKDGNVIENMYEEDGTSGIPGMLGKYDLTNIEKIKSGGREFKVEYVFMAPSETYGSKETPVFFNAVKKELDAADGKKHHQINSPELGADGKLMYMEKYPLEYTYEKGTVNDSFLFTLRNQDRENYYKDGSKAQIVIILTEKEPIHEIRIVQEEQPEGPPVTIHTDEKPEPTIVEKPGKTDDLIPDVPHPDYPDAKFKKWHKDDEYDPERDEWNPNKKTPEEDPKPTIPVEPGDNIYELYVIPLENKDDDGEGNLKILEKEISIKTDLTKLEDFELDADDEGELPKKAKGEWPLIEPIPYKELKEMEHSFATADGGSGKCRPYQKVVENKCQSEYELEEPDERLVAGYKVKRNTLKFKDTWGFGAEIKEDNRPNTEMVVWRTPDDVPTAPSYVDQSLDGILTDKMHIQSDIKPSPKSNTRTDPGNRIVFNRTLNIKFKPVFYTNPSYYWLVHPCKITEPILQYAKYMKRNLTYDINVMIEHREGYEGKGLKKGKKYTTGTFKIGSRNYKAASGNPINVAGNIQFYPYIEMLFANNGSSIGTFRKVKMLSQDKSTIDGSDYIEIGMAKEENGQERNPDFENMDIDSKQWSTHRRTQVNGEKNTLPGGAIYELKEKENTKTFVGFKLWQYQLGEETESKGAAVAGADNYCKGMVEKRRKDFEKKVGESLENAEMVQHIKEDKAKKYSDFVDAQGKDKDGSLELLIDRLEHRTQEVFGQTTNKDTKYYLKRNSNVAEGEEHKVDDANLDMKDGGENNELKPKNQRVYTIKSDEKGNVWVERLETIRDGHETGASGTGSKIASIGKGTSNNDGKEKFLQNEELKALDKATKLITNYFLAIDRRHGNYKGEKWYHEGFIGISVVLTEYEVEMGFEGPAVRSSALDTKLTDKIMSKADIYNDEKTRSSIFLTGTQTTNNKDKAPGTLAVLTGNGLDGDAEIKMNNLHMLFMTKVFYVPNATVTDLN